jgi:predicted helicase
MSGEGGPGDFQGPLEGDLGGDVRANPKLPGTKHNVFGIQTGVAISFLVKRKGAEGCRIRYARRPEMETAEEKLSFLSTVRVAGLQSDEVRPDANRNWINQTDNDFHSLIAVAVRRGKFGRANSQAKSVFSSFTIGVSTNRDDWVSDHSRMLLAKKFDCIQSEFLKEVDLHKEHLKSGHEENDFTFGDGIKWSEGLKNALKEGNIKSHARRGSLDSRIGRLLRSFTFLILFSPIG